MSERDKRHYAKVKADPVKYAEYLARKRQERKPRTAEYDRERKRKWRLDNSEHADLLRKANHAVERGIIDGLLVRAKCCSKCGSSEQVEAHHRSYEPQYWLVVEWLCRGRCHPEADRERTATHPTSLTTENEG